LSLERRVRLDVTKERSQLLLSRAADRRIVKEHVATVTELSTEPLEVAKGSGIGGIAVDQYKPISSVRRSRRFGIFCVNPDAFFKPV
jgi:hypothetical protein